MTEEQAKASIGKKVWSDGQQMEIVELNIHQSKYEDRVMDWAMSGAVGEKPDEKDFYIASLKVCGTENDMRWDYISCLKLV